MLSDSDMLTILSDGLLNDLLLSVYSDIGLPLNKPYSTGYITPTVSFTEFCRIYLLFYFLVVETR